MKGLVNLVNERPLSKGCTLSPNEDNPIIFGKWEIYRWTGWKGNTFIVEDKDKFYPPNCPVCEKPFKTGDKVVAFANTDRIEHFECSGSIIKGQIFGQWIAVQIVDPNDWSSNRYVYASAPGSKSAYLKHDLFDLDVREGQQELTVDTPQEILEAAREKCLERLKKYITDIEAGNVPWPSLWAPKT